MPYPTTGYNANPWNYGLNQPVQYTSPQVYPISQPSLNTFVWVQGDPRQKVQELLDSGQMTQEQLNQLMGMANQFKGMLPK